MGLINGDEKSPVALFPAAVTATACDHLRAEIREDQLEPGRVVDVGERVDREMHMRFLDKSHWAGELVMGAAAQANERMGWHIDLSALESLQLGRYVPGDHHDWHMDALSHGDLVRKLTVVVQLDDGEAYEGGDIELLRFGVDRPDVLELPDETRARGTTLVFPSYLVHRVAPVTRGVRHTLVGWMAGPRWR